MEFLQKHGLDSPIQHAYRKGKSCMSAWADINSFILKSRDAGHCTVGLPENGDISWITLLLWALIDFVFSFPDILIKVSKYVIYLEETNYFLFSAWMMTKLLLQAAYLLRHSVSSCFSVLSCGLKAWFVHVEQTKCECNCCSRQDLLRKA